MATAFALPVELPASRTRARPAAVASARLEPIPPARQHPQPPRGPEAARSPARCGVRAGERALSYGALREWRCWLGAPRSAGLPGSARSIAYVRARAGKWRPIPAPEIARASADSAGATELVVELAGAGDAAALAALDRATLDGMWTENGYLEEVSSSASDLIVVRGPAGELAAAVCLFDVLGEASLVILAVDRPFQRRGIGGWLCAIALQRAAERGNFACYLEVRESNLEARAMYSKFGFTTVGRRKGYYEDREDAVTMMAVLTDPACLDAIASERARGEEKMALAGLTARIDLPPAPEGGIPGYMHLSRGDLGV